MMVTIESTMQRPLTHAPRPPRETVKSAEAGTMPRVPTIRK